jgi:hypothetical protein
VVRGEVEPPTFRFSVLMPSFRLSMRQQWFTHVRLLVTHLTRCQRAFSATLTTPALITVAEPDVVIRAVGRCYLPALSQVRVPRALAEGPEHARGRGRQPPDDRVC